MILVKTQVVMVLSRAQFFNFNGLSQSMKHTLQVTAVSDASHYKSLQRRLIEPIELQC